MKKIKELSEHLNISPRTIRFYEEKGMISPAKHPKNQYRVFDEKDARRLQTIISLREVGMTLDEIKALLDESGDGVSYNETDPILYALELQRSMMFSEFVALKQNIETTDRIINSVKKTSAISWEEIFEITSGLKRLRGLRSNWRDQWNFDRQAAFHDELVHQEPSELQFNSHPSYALALQTILAWVNPHKGEKGLDIGTGTGNLAGVFLEQGIEMCGIDQSIEMLKQSNRKFPAIETKLGNFLAIPYLDHSFDFAVTSYAFHHLNEGQKLLALDEIRRVLRPHGRICLVDLMFKDEDARASHLLQLAQEGKQDVITTIENEFYGDRSKLIEWFDEQGYITKVKQLNELLHIVYAVPTRTTY